MPEFIQDQATPGALAAAVLDYFTNMVQVGAVQEVFADLHQQLAVDNTKLAVTAVLELINIRTSSGVAPNSWSR